MKKISQRDSNIELLRIIAMVMVLVLHADINALGTPSSVEINDKPVVSIARIILDMMSVGAVNIFVLISGWFTIKPSVKGFSSFIFQWLFFSVGIYAILVLIGQTEISIGGLARCLALTDAPYYWFIPSYICLYIFSPVLNAFVNTSSQKEFRIVILAFFIFQTLYSFISGGAEFLMKGYSALSFIGLYLLAAYVKKYIDITVVHRRYYLYSYIVLSLILSFVFVVCRINGIGPVTSRILSYSNPLVISSSLLLLLYFTQLSFKSVIVNSISRSSFAVYLLHCSPFIISTVFLPSISRFDGCPLRIITVLIMWFVAAILIDKLRLIFWMILSSNHQKGQR